MKFELVKSSNIAAIGYDSNTRTLGIRFVNGTEYHYFNVPEQVHKNLMSARSVGSYFNQNVKDGPYRYKQLK